MSYRSCEKGASMPNKTYLNPDTMSQPRGYTHAVKVGNTAYIAGQASVARDGSVVGKGDPEAQARQMAQPGGRRQVRRWHPQRYREDDDARHQYELRRRHTKVREERFPTNPPTSTLLVVAGLASPDYHDGD